MSAYALTRASEGALRMLLATGGSEQLLLQRPISDLRADVTVTPTRDRIEAVVHFGDFTYSTSLPAGDTANLQHLADFIDAAANGNVENAAPTARRAGLGACDIAYARLTRDDERCIQKLSSMGGTAELSTGSKVTMHASPGGPKVTAIVVHGKRTEICSGSQADVRRSVAELVEQLAA